jgi:hypothetical protein
MIRIIAKEVDMRKLLIVWVVLFFASVSQAQDVSKDCKVEWQGTWHDAKVLKTEKDRWLIHYVGYEESWDEWVKKDRIRLEKKRLPVGKIDIAGRDLDGKSFSLSDYRGNVVMLVFWGEW